MTAIDPSVYDDPKISQTLAMLAEGKTKEEIVKHFGNKSWATIDMYFRRKGFRWNGKTFEPREEGGTDAVEEARFVQTKAAQIVRQLSQKYADIRQVAIKNGFPSIEEMGDYMKSQGYVWNSDINNYEYDENMAQKQRLQPKKTQGKASGKVEGLPDEYRDLLAYLLDRKERLYELLEPQNSGTLPRYKFKGAKANKTLGLPTSLQTLLNDFSKEFNVTQRDIIEVALAEFFRKYGYEEQLNSVLQV
ncbi:hypothetical protein HNQ82_000832 [Anoxybacillus tengchongensis]|uniref:Uncharacterized protein n=1 Tax=Anoxybacillus tengchongensis TaxID=576944 RepID=A0A7W9YRQ2_9BACL|nr:hypothetical protein [Anoxybacillus tengchongensis]MBB6176021.1 hypothetical protein [Anoxybacillus tengchongensis]